MARRFTDDTLVIASHNPGKIREIADLLAPFARHFPSAGAFGLSEPEETGADFRANAELKARHAAAGSGRPALADDSGLVVPALDGEPGIRSARWAEGPDGRRDFRLAMERVNDGLAALGGAAAVRESRADTPAAAEAGPARRAHFVCALSLAWPDGQCETVEGYVHGRLVWPPRGDRGFGYDPMFVPNGYDITFGEMEPAEKHRISHRADAFRQLTARCFR
jgi:XTP/dITP diphosphohydrolase